MYGTAEEGGTAPEIVLDPVAETAAEREFFAGAQNDDVFPIIARL